MEILTFIDPASGQSLYCIGPFADKREAQAQAVSAAQPAQPQPAAPSPVAQPAKRPNGPITRRCWEIFDLLGESLEKSKLIAACESQGIQKGTALAQFSKWKAARAKAQPAASESA